MGVYRQGILQREVDRFGKKKVLDENPDLKKEDRRFVEGLPEEKQNTEPDIDEEENKKKKVAQESTARARPSLNPVGVNSSRQRFLKGV